MFTFKFSRLRNVRLNVNGLTAREPSGDAGLEFVGKEEKKMALGHGAFSFDRCWIGFDVWIEVGFGIKKKKMALGHSAFSIGHCWIGFV